MNDDDTDDSTHENLATVVMTMRDGFSRNVAFLGPAAVVGRWSAKSSARSLYGTERWVGVEQGVDEG